MAGKAGNVGERLLAALLLQSNVRQYLLFTYVPWAVALRMLM